MNESTTITEANGSSNWFAYIDIPSYAGALIIAVNTNSHSHSSQIMNFYMKKDCQDTEDNYDFYHQTNLTGDINSDFIYVFDSCPADVGGTWSTLITCENHSACYFSILFYGFF